MDELNRPPLLFTPRSPESLEEIDVSEALLTDLILRRIYVEGDTSLRSLGSALKLSHPIVRAIFMRLRQQQLFDVKGMVGNDYNFSLTSAGRQLASERFKISQYIGPAPVSLQTYTQAVKTQVAKVRLNRDILRECLSDLVLNDTLLDQVGPSLVSQMSLFLYGSTGNGKTCLAERFLRVFKDAVLVPYAVEVDNQIIVLHDPVVHRRIDCDYEDLDPRWVVCQRPSVIVGGELDLSMLELQLDPATGIYAAPVQMKANNGIFVIDDFGRQLVAPQNLLNRWIVPLDRRVDYLTLKYGVKFPIPFETMVVFATNLDPSSLADEAFFRRIKNKVFVDCVSAAAFDEIFDRSTREKNLPVEVESPAYLRELCLSDGREVLRACYPSDIVNIVMSICEYEERPVAISKSDLKRAAEIYFTKHYHRFPDMGVAAVR